MTQKSKTHQVAVETLELSRDLSLSELQGFFEGTELVVLAWNPVESSNGALRGLVENRKSTMNMMLKEGDFLVRVQDQVFKPQSAEVIRDSWGVTV